MLIMAQSFNYGNAKKRTVLLDIPSWGWNQYCAECTADPIAAGRSGGSFGNACKLLDRFFGACQKCPAAHTIPTV